MIGLISLVLLLWTSTVWADFSSSNSTQLQDEGVSQGNVKKLNCVGAGVTCTRSGVTGTMTIPGGGTGSANVTQVSIDLGTSGGLYFTTTVTGQAWVTISSVIACSAYGTTVDGQTAETVAVSGVISTVANLVVGTGFDLMVFSPFGATGTYRFNCTGA